MARARLSQTSFTGGELSPRVLGHTDVDRYSTGLRKARNMHPVIQGGLKRRAGTLYTAAALSNTARRSRLVPFVQGANRAWMLEFGDLTVRIYASDGTYTGVQLATPYVPELLALIDYAQSDATMYLFHPDVPIHRLVRLTSGTWVLSPVPFTQQPFAEVGLQDGPNVTLSAATVGTGRTATAASAYFLAGDVGRAILFDAGIAVITAYTSSTVVTVEITRAFPAVLLTGGLWTLEGSPQVTVTPSAAGPEGATITLTASAAAWRAQNVGSLARLNGGLARISAFTSGTAVSAVVVRELSGVTAAPPLAWSLEAPLWSAAYGYPRTGTVHQQRLVAAGTIKFPRTVWGSRIGEPLDFTIGTADDEAFAFTVESDESTPIVYVSGGKGLAVFTESCEYSMRGGVEKPITPTNVRIEPESNHGATDVRPVSVNRETLFVQRAGRKIRAYGYRYDFDGYSSVDITALAEHLTAGGVVAMAYQQEPDQLLWVALANGKMLTCTIDRDQQPSVIGWAMHETDGQVDSVATIPNGLSDQVWIIVRRTIAGSPVRMIERMDETLVPLHPSVSTTGPVYGATMDSCRVFDNPAGLTSVSIPHLAGKVVDILLDGSQQPRQTVGAGGALTFVRSAKRAIVGLPFESRATLLTPEFNAGEGSVAGQSHRTGQLVMRFLDTVGGQVVNNIGGQQPIPIRRFGPGILDEAPEPFTGALRVTMLGWDRGDAETGVAQLDPYPMHLLSINRTHTAQG